MKTFALIASICMMSSAWAYEAQVKKGELAPDLEVLLSKARAETGAAFLASDFLLIEERILATSKFTMYVQSNSKVPVAKTAVRIWSDLKTNNLILAEMHLDEIIQNNKKNLQDKFLKAKFSSPALKSKKLSAVITDLVSKEISKHQTDSKILGYKTTDQWEKGDLVRVVEVRGRRGIHHVTVSLLKNKIISSRYSEFPQSEVVTLKAHVFPIYEEVEGTGERLPYELKDLKFVQSKIHDGGELPLGSFSNLKFPENRYFPLLAETPMGELYDLWSEASLRKKIEALVSTFPLKDNSFESGLLLQGKYVTINLHPDIQKSFEDISFKLSPSNHHLLTWIQNNGFYEGRPVSGLNGKSFHSSDELQNLIPFRHPEHDATTYINSGFDEVQVYYGVTALMESLVEMGFTDPGLSEKPFHAFLFDPDIGMKDNAYYYDNTINFTTYNPGSPNLARDNPTIWHELGHAIMERLMGAHLGFADSASGYGGLSEGMADFVSQIVLEHQTDGADFPGKNDFRIINETGFYLTNEFHDDGESYGGAMNDMLSLVISYEGKAGLMSFTDLTLEAMRLTRNHPSLSARAWFEHMLYADELGSAVRASGKYKDIITNALTARNFSFDKNFVPAKMDITFNNTVLTDESLGSRNNPLTPCGEEFVSYELNLALTKGEARFIEFPATVKVEYKKGALQGAIKWMGEEVNPQVYTVASEDSVLKFPISAYMECDSINQPDGSCKDYAYIQVFNQGSLKPVAKKRFYLKLNKSACEIQE